MAPRRRPRLPGGHGGAAGRVLRAAAQPTVTQNWLAALTTVVDASAYAIAYGPEEAVHAAELTFRIGRHALADLA